MRIRDWTICFLILAGTVLSVSAAGMRLADAWPEHSRGLYVSASWLYYAAGAVQLWGASAMGKLAGKFIRPTVNAGAEHYQSAQAFMDHWMVGWLLMAVGLFLKFVS